jgi:hypothetical protein
MQQGRLRCNEQIVAADRSSDLFEPSADLGISGIGGRLEREHVQCVKYRFQLHRQRSSVAQFCGDDDAGADLGLALTAST